MISLTLLCASENTNLISFNLQAKQLTLSQKEEALNLFVKDGWLAETPDRRGYYSLGVSFLTQALCWTFLL